MKILLSKKIKSIPRHFWILLAIILLGIFLRTYHFSDWLIFNSDQARDASVVRNMLEKGDMPLLGPVAGGTFFQLGSAFYYFQYAGAKIFGNTPDKMAYADLLFGILAIPLLYLLARQYFKRNVSLMLMALYATAFFTVQYSRFAWNPNSAQFFSMLFLYAILRLWDSDSNKQLGWVILAGVALGISVQLHTLLLFGLPVVFFILAIYLRDNKRLKPSNIVLIIFIALLLNATQIKNEIQTRGGNYNQLLYALLGKSDHQNPMWKNTVFVATCQAQSSIKILVPYANQEDCDFPLADKYFKRLSNRMDSSVDWLLYATKIIVVLLFSGGSYWLFYRKIRKKGVEGREKFIILAIFSLVLLAIFVPFGAEISLRYFILLVFMPFLLLGLMLEFFWEKYGPRGRFVASILICGIIGYNLFFCLLNFRAHANNVPGNMIDGTATQAEKIMDYLIERSAGAKKIQIGGQKNNLGRFYNRISYFAENKGVEIVSLDSTAVVDPNLPTFYAISEMSGKCEIGAFYKYGYVEECGKMYDIALLKLDIRK